MTTHVRLTYEDYAALPDDSRRYELHEGELSVTPSPGLSHQDTLGNLFVIARGHVHSRALGRVFVAPMPMDCIVDPPTRVIEAYQLDRDAYRAAGTLSGPERVSLPPFPDLALDPQEIWPGQL